MPDVTVHAIATVIVRMVVKVAVDTDATFIALIVVMRVARTHAEMDVTEHVRKAVEKHVVVLAREVALVLVKIVVQEVAKILVLVVQNSYPCPQGRLKNKMIHGNLAWPSPSPSSSRRTASWLASIATS